MMTAQRPGQLVSLTIDGRRLQAAEGSFVLQAAREAGIDIPTLCDHPDLEPIGACRLCMVEVTHPDWKGWKGLMTSCLYPIVDGIEVSTRSDAVLQARRGVLSLLAARCPNSKVVGDLAAKYGASTDGLLVDPEADDCIVCGLCSRVCDSYATGAITTCFRGTIKRVGSFADAPPADCVGCGACVSICPTGHLHGTRTAEGYEVWGRTFAANVCQVDESHCIGCGACEEACPFDVARVTLRRGGELVAGIPVEHCRGCGACVGACPSSAISPGRPLSPLPKASRGEGVSEVVIACSRSHLSGQMPDNTALVELPCTGWVTLPMLLEPFARGARGVLVLGRHEKTCRLEGAEDPVRDRVQQARHLLELSGMHPDRLFFDEPPLGPAGPRIAIRSFHASLEKLGANPLREPPPADILGEGGLDGMLALLEWMSLRPEIEPSPSAWLRRHGLPSTLPGTPVLLSGGLPFLSVLARDLARPTRLTDSLTAALTVLGFLGHRNTGVQLGPWRGALRPAAMAAYRDKRPVFSLCRMHNADLDKAGVHVVSLDDLLIEQGAKLPRPPVSSAVACDGSDPRHVQLLEALGYQPLDVGPDPLPNSYQFSPAQRTQAEARLRLAEHGGACALLINGPRSLARWAIVTRDGTWRQSRVLPVSGAQLASLSLAQRPLARNALVHSVGHDAPTPHSGPSVRPSSQEVAS